MSTTGRGRRRAAARQAAGRGSLAQRAVRMRNACVRHAAADLGLEQPTAEDLRALTDDATLREAVEWWQGRAAVSVAEPTPPPRAGSSMLAKAAVIAGVTLLALAVSSSPVQ